MFLLVAAQVKSSEQVGGFIIGCDDYSLKSSLAGFLPQIISSPAGSGLRLFGPLRLSCPQLGPSPLPGSWLAAVGLLGPRSAASRSRNLPRPARGPSFSPHTCVGLYWDVPTPAALSLSRPPPPTTQFFLMGRLAVPCIPEVSPPLSLRWWKGLSHFLI